MNLLTRDGRHVDVDLEGAHVDVTMSRNPPADHPWIVVIVTRAGAVHEIGWYATRGEAEGWRRQIARRCYADLGLVSWR